MRDNRSGPFYNRPITQNERVSGADRSGIPSHEKGPQYYCGCLECRKNRQHDNYDPDDILDDHRHIEHKWALGGELIWRIELFFKRIRNRLAKQVEPPY